MKVTRICLLIIFFVLSHVSATPKQIQKHCCSVELVFADDFDWFCPPLTRPLLSILSVTTGRSINHHSVLYNNNHFKSMTYIISIPMSHFAIT